MHWLKEKIKSIGYVLLTLGFVAILLVAFVFFIKGNVWIFENFYPFFVKVDAWVWGAMIILLLLSLFPRLRIYTGQWIILGTYVWGVLFWITCVFITYSLWGIIGVLLGLIFLGVGVFATAILALLFSGAIGGAIFFVLSLFIIYLFRILGSWIMTKHRSREVLPPAYHDK